MIDYRKILIAYINHVGVCEGCDFLGTGPSDMLDGLTEEEAVALAKCRDAGDRMPEFKYYKTPAEWGD